MGRVIAKGKRKEDTGGGWNRLGGECKTEAGSWGGAGSLRTQGEPSLSHLCVPMSPHLGPGVALHKPVERMEVRMWCVLYVRTPVFSLDSTVVKAQMGFGFLILWLVLCINPLSLHVAD